MTPEEFLKLKRGDKILLDEELVPYEYYDGVPKEVEVAGIKIGSINIKIGSKNTNYATILIFTEYGWGQKIQGWLEAYNLPAEDKNKWATIITINDVDHITLVDTTPKQISRGNGEVCKVCKEHNFWADKNYPKEDPKIFVCWNCQDSRRWMIPQV